jgi:hypothetical protein
MKVAGQREAKEKKEDKMKKFLTATTCLVFLGLFLHGSTSVQQMTTGDTRLDSLLGNINEQAKADPKEFIRLLSQKNNVPEEALQQVKDQFGLSFGDTYMATAFSRISNQPLDVVAEAYNRNRGQGWGVMAMNMGIKPGSPAFKALKANAHSHVDHMKTTAKLKKKQQEQEMKKERERGRKTKD